jgi:hypothetical protein
MQNRSGPVEMVTASSVSSTLSDVAEPSSPPFASVNIASSPGLRLACVSTSSHRMDPSPGLQRLMTSNWAGTALPFASSSTALPGSFNAPCGKGMPVVTGQFVRETPEGSFRNRLGHRRDGQGHAKGQYNSGRSIHLHLPSHVMRYRS